MGSSVRNWAERVMAVTLTLQVSAAAVAALREGKLDILERGFSETVQDLGVKLEPMDPETSDPDLQCIFTVQVPDADHAAQVSERLKRFWPVEGAYIKPPGEPPDEPAFD